MLSEPVLPDSSTKERCVSSKHKAVLIALTVGEYNVRELSHHALGARGHQPQGTTVVGLLKPVLV